MDNDQDISSRMYHQEREQHQSREALLISSINRLSEENESLKKRIKELTKGMVSIVKHLKKMALSAKKNGGWEDQLKD